jgi:proliferating cell nuclear antigen
MSFLLESNRIRYLYDILDMVSSVLTTTTIAIQSDGLYISDMDSSHISFIQLELSKTDFVRYDTTFRNNQSQIIIGISLPELVKIIKTGINNDKIILEYKDSNKLDIVFNGCGLTRRYKLPLIDTEPSDLTIPSMDYPLELEISSKLFNNIIQSIAITDTEAILFKVNNKTLKIESETNEVDSVIQVCFDKQEEFVTKNKHRIHPGNKTIVLDKCKELIYRLHSCEGVFNALFNLNRIKLFVKAYSLASTVMCNISNNSPIRLDYELNETGSVLYYYISPKINEE